MKTLSLEPNFYSGSLYYSSRGASFWDALHRSALSYEEAQLSVSGWILLRIQPEQNWIPNDEIIVSPNDHQYQYDFLIRIGRENRLFISSTKSELVVMLLKKLGLEDWINSTPTVNVNGLVTDLMEKPKKTNYSLGAIYARIDGYNQALKTILLYGNDITSAPLYREHISPFAEPYRVTLRKARYQEILSIGDKADISFRIHDETTLVDFDEALRTIRNLNRLDWEVTSNE